MDFLLELAWKNAAVAGVLAVLVALLARWIRRPAFRHALWLLVLIKLVTPPLWHCAIPWPEPAQADPPVSAPELVPTAPGDSGVLAAATAAQVLADPVGSRHEPLADADFVGPRMAAGTPPVVPAQGATLPALPSSEPAPPGRFHWQKAVAAVWLAGSSIWLAILLNRFRRFRRLAGYASPASSEESLRVAQLADRIGLRRPPVFRLVNARIPPMTWGIAGRHELLVPAHLWRSLPPAQRDALVLHELVHLRRGDHWVRQFELLVLALHWWHPVTWWARHELQKAEEECCDAWVVGGLPGIAGEYAELIVETIAFLSASSRTALPPLASGLGQIRHVRQRLSAILGRPAAPRLSIVAWASLAAAAVCFLPVTVDRPRDLRAAGSGFPVSPSSAGLEDETIRGLTGISQDLPAGADLDVLLENLTILQLQLVQREAELTEEKLLLEQAGRAARRGTALAARGAVALSALEASLTDQKVREARVRGREAAVQELKLLIQREQSRINRQGLVRRSGTGGVNRSLPAPEKPASDSRAGPPPALEQQQKRLDRIEHRLDDLFTQARALAEELKREQTARD